MSMDTCEYCGTGYNKNDYRQKYCSRSCAATVNNRKYPKRTDEITYCPICGKQKVKQNKTCSYDCGVEYKYREYVKRWLGGEENGVSGKQSTSTYIKKYLREQKNECWECGWSEVNQWTEKVPVQIDHINGKWDDNRIENLRLLCPNCHSLTGTYGALNKGNGRSGRYS